MSYQQPAGPRQLRGSTVIITGAVLAILAMVAVITIGRRHSPETAAAPAAPWLVPWQPPIALQSSPPDPALSPAALATAGRQPVSRSSPPSHRSSHQPSVKPSRTAARMLPEPGSGVSLLAAGSTDLRLRHNDFRMRLATIGPRSPSAARADASFVLRRGLADARCISLESVNFPGWFMRHQNFVLRLQPRDSSRLYEADTTFCPQAAGSDGDFLLRSVNYPDRYLTASDTRVLLSRIPATAAQRFRSAPGLAPTAGAQG
jgi:hypothetical protein